jgi:hypothetical protein
MVKKKNSLHIYYIVSPFKMIYKKYSTQKKGRLKLYSSLIGHYVAVTVTIILYYLCLNSYHLTPTLEASSSISQCS